MRRFLGWNKPFLPLAVEHLFSTYRSGDLVDLSSLVVVMPVSRGLRRLGELLQHRAATEKVILRLPRQMVTTGGLPELLLPKYPKRATPYEEQIGWFSALQALPQKRREILAPGEGEPNAAKLWSLAEVCRSLWTTVVNGGHTFADVKKILDESPDTPEDERWSVLQELFDGYRAVLEKQELVDLQYERLSGSPKLGEGMELMLFACAELSTLVKKLLTNLKGEVTSLVFAPETHADYFDEWGGIIPKEWIKEKLAVEEQRIGIGTVPFHQAEKVLEKIGTWAPRATVDEITVGVTDDSLGPLILEQGAYRGVPIRFAAGQPFSLTLLGSLVGAVVAYTEGNSWRAFGALLRHPLIEQYLVRKIPSENLPRLLSIADRFYADHLPMNVDISLIAPEAETLRDVILKLDELLLPLKKETLWEGLSKVLGAILDGSDQVGSDEQEVIVRALEEVSQINSILFSSLKKEEARALFLKILGDKEVPPTSNERSIEMLGWLELQLDDAPYVAVAGMNEGSVPGVINSDPFLPNRARTLLGLTDNDARCARDKYLLSTLLNARKEAFFVAGRATSQGEPLLLTRLLLSGGIEEVAARSLRFYNEAHTPRGGEKASAKSAFQIPPPPEPVKKGLTTISVTSLKSYLRCPYRYYLEHVLKLRDERDDEVEMDPLVFGEVMHTVLQKWGEKRKTGPAKEIGRELSKLLWNEVRHRFGATPRAAVKIQAHQAEARLLAFATQQEAWENGGFQIAEIEKELPLAHRVIEVDGVPCELTAKIDRIDVSADGSLVVMDYKTGDAPPDPRRSHWSERDQAWKDLQLPLYAYLAKKAYPGRQVSTAYCVLPAKLESTEIISVEWSDEELSSAVDEAKRIIRDIRAEKFWPPSPLPSVGDPFAPLLGVKQIMEEGE